MTSLGGAYVKETSFKKFSFNFTCAYYSRDSL